MARINIAMCTSTVGAVDFHRLRICILGQLHLKGSGGSVAWGPVGEFHPKWSKFGKIVHIGSII